MSSASENQLISRDTKSDLNCEFLIIINNENEQQTVKIKNNKKDENICKFCEKKLSSKKYLKMHMKNHHPNETSSKVYFCDHCPKKYFGKNCLISHLKSKHQKGKEIKFECNFDGKTFYTKNKLYIHMTKCHQTIEECKICGKKVKILYQHVKQIHLNKKVQCHLCIKTFNNKNYLNQHLKTHNKQHQCQLCGYKFSLIVQLKEHQKVHENQFAFRCEICQKTLSCSFRLREHLRTHDKNRIKRHKCQQCEYSTDIKNDLRIHLRTHDKNREKPLKCNQCDFKTDIKTKLKLHLQIHNPNRVKIPCLYCNYEATTRGNLQRHLKTQHVSNIIKKTY
ncbi:hypothetical protein PVAND_017408 [Polypedilum vanderplanki]|uniref:C2H2-type domain-containing protein n=1 Tax=Polypedilum vanderplanki TaxID=319348 RepID=A0A9J6BHZ7_POLVA|nr:hypothetical protein PVAND_017408 [Polypedilum vanderplanki]